MAGDGLFAAGETMTIDDETAVTALFKISRSVQPGIEHETPAIMKLAFYTFCFHVTFQ
jgi:hypothetical protein